MKSKLTSHAGKTNEELIAAYRRNYTRYSNLLAELKPVKAAKGSEAWKSQTIERLKIEAALRNKLHIAKRELSKLQAWKI